MTEALLHNEPLIRGFAFFGMLIAMALWEAAAPCRGPAVSRRLRWTNNLAIAILNTLLARVMAPGAALGVALAVDAQGWGLPVFRALPGWLAIPLAVVVLDFVIWWQHRLFHALPLLWRLHRMHHTDLDFDVTTGVRFHPIEILVSLGIKIAVVMALAPPPAAVLLFAVVLNATAMFSHGNVRLPGRLDRALRWVMVTPDMHRIHHSVHRFETDSNFGFNLTWWDRLFGTYRADPQDGHTAMTIGLPTFRAPAELRLDRLLRQPFMGRGRDQG